MAASKNVNQEEKKEWVNPEFLTEGIQQTEGGTHAGAAEDGMYGS